MHKTDIVDLSVAEIMSTWPSAIRVFLDHRMHCVGCPIAPFHTLPEAAGEHGVLLADLVADLDREKLKGAPAPSRRQSAAGHADRV